MWDKDHNSAHYPHSTGIERMRLVLKRVLQGLRYYHVSGWEYCLPATMSVLHSVLHETAGSNPAALVYGCTLRTSLNMLKESWEEGRICLCAERGQPDGHRLPTSNE